jgi:RNase P/RNase MRP subunit POP5
MPPKLRENGTLPSACLTTIITDEGLGAGMTVKSVRGRRRYISFEVPEGTDRDGIVMALEKAEPPVPSAKAITCGKGKAVIRCSPADREAAVSAISSSFGGSKSLRTSGTLRSLRDLDPDLRVPRKRKK